MALDFYLSGGAGNTNPNNSLGGARSSQILAADSCGYLSGDSIAGVTILGGYGNYLYTGSVNNPSLKYSVLNGAKRLIFTPFGVAAGTLLDDISNALLVHAGGEFSLVWSDAGGYRSVTVSVTPASLPVIDTTARLVVSRGMNSLFDNTKVESDYLPEVDYRGVYLMNNDAASVAAKVFMERPAGSANILLGLDPSGVNGVPATLANEATAPSGVTFSQAIDEDSSLAVTLAAGDQIAVWIKRTTVGLLPQSVTGDSFGLIALVTA